jgi:hypothetical protein
MRVRLRNSRTGMFLCAEPNGNTVVNRPSPGEWETFQVERGHHHHHGAVAFRSQHGRFLCCEPSGACMANRDAVGEWESFRVQPAPNGRSIVIRSHHNTLLLATGNNDLYANRDNSPDAEEMWDVSFA